ncbi:hypothetical protein BH10CHL1_BH10CHL1_45820 [soil metagenome]
MTFLKTLYQAIPLKRFPFGLMRQIWTPPFYKRLYASGSFRINVGDGCYFWMNGYEEYGIETELFWKGIEGGWEVTSLAAWKQLCREAKTVLDIGANHGIYSLFTKAVNPRARIVAFEPLQSAYARLRANISLNQFDIECFDFAISDCNGKATFYSNNANSSTESSLVRSRIDDSELVEISVETRKLDTLCNALKLTHIDLMKIDVEGAESAVFEGMHQLLQHNRPNILIEVLTDEVGVELDKMVSDLGYTYYDVNDDPRNGPLQIKKVDRIRKGTCLNLLLVNNKGNNIIKNERSLWNS